MGYAYGPGPRGGFALSCDECGRCTGDARKRTCPRKVLTDSTRSPQRQEIPYCYPPALCADCWQRLGRTAGVHGDCAEGAARATAQYDEVERRFQAGEGYVISARGSWAEGVPDGWTLTTFAFPHGGDVRSGWRDYLVPADQYDRRSGDRGQWLTDYPDAIPAEHGEALQALAEVAR